MSTSTPVPTFTDSILMLNAPTTLPDRLEPTPELLAELPHSDEFETAQPRRWLGPLSSSAIG